MIQIAHVPLVDHFLPEGVVLPQHRQFQTLLLHDPHGFTDVFQLKPGPSSGHEISSHHALAVLGENTTFREPSPDRFPHPAGSTPAAFARVSASAMAAMVWATMI